MKLLEKAEWKTLSIALPKNKHLTRQTLSQLFETPKPPWHKQIQESRWQIDFKRAPRLGEKPRKDSVVIFLLANEPVQSIRTKWLEKLNAGKRWCWHCWRWLYSLYPALRLTLSFVGTIQLKPTQSMVSQRVFQFRKHSDDEIPSLSYQVKL